MFDWIYSNHFIFLWNIVILQEDWIKLLTSLCSIPSTILKLFDFPIWNKWRQRRRKIYWNLKLFPFNILKSFLLKELRQVEFELSFQTEDSWSYSSSEPGLDCLQSEVWETDVVMTSKRGLYNPLNTEHPTSNIQPSSHNCTDGRKSVI